MSETNTAWFYLRTEPSLWTVGFYGPGGRFEPESDHGTAEAAAERCAWLNGSVKDAAALRARVSELEFAITRWKLEELHNQACLCVQPNEGVIGETPWCFACDKPRNFADVKLTDAERALVQAARKEQR